MSGALPVTTAITNIAVFWCVTPCIGGNLANNIVGGWGNRPWVLRVLRSSQVRKRGKIGLIQPFSPFSSKFFLFAPLQVSSQKKLFLGKKKIGLL
jgi:hypothetical protein